jgi:hypothetical protein
MSAISLFEEKQVRRAWNAEQKKWLFAIVDVIAILTGSPNSQVYWRVLKKRLTDEGNETVTNCNALKMTAADGKQRMTDVAGKARLDLEKQSGKRISTKENFKALPEAKAKSLRNKSQPSD